MPTGGLSPGRINAHKYAVMRPIQFATQCVEFWKCKVELPHVTQNNGNAGTVPEISKHFRGEE